LVLRKLVCGDGRPPLPGLCEPVPPRKEGDLPTPFMVGEDLGGGLLDVRVAGDFELGAFGGFLLRPDMIEH